MSILKHSNLTYFQNSLNNYLSKPNESYLQNKIIESKSLKENKESKSKAEWVRVDNKLVCRLISED